MRNIMNKPLYVLSLLEALKGIEDRQFTCEDYTRVLLDRIQALDGQIQAWAFLEPVQAIQAARLTDGFLRSKVPAGLLQGLPMGIKDIFATAGMPTQMGSPAFAGHIPNASAKVIERLQAQGGFVMGKTVTTECAFLFPGKTRNPWNPRHTPGGSSSGSAAAVAAGFVPAALGSQTNGSVIRPAAFCGIVGYKPTQGLLSMHGALTFSHTLDQAGIFTRCVQDAAFLAFALGSGKPITQDALTHKAPPRLAAVKTPVWQEAEDAAKQHFYQTIEILRSGGAEVAQIELPDGFARAHRAIRSIMAAEAAFNLGELYLAHPSTLSSVLTDFLVEGQTTGAVAYIEALGIRQDLQQELARFLGGYDAVITPPTPGEAPATLEQTGSPSFCSIWSLCGVPAITIPTGFGPRGLPLGLQIVGPRGKDEQVLAAAHWCEGQFGFPTFDRS